MNADQLARIRLAIDGDANLDEQMTAPPWVSVDGNVETPDGLVAWATHDDTAEMDPWNAAGIARARNRWALYLGLARAVGDMVQALDTDNEPHAGFTYERLKAALAALAEGEASDGQ